MGNLRLTPSRSLTFVRRSTSGSAVSHPRRVLAGWPTSRTNPGGEVYIQAFPEPRGKFQISTGGGTHPQWGVSGRELFYVSPENKLMTVSLKLGEGSVAPSAPRELFQLRTNSAEPWNPYEVESSGQRFLVAAIPDQAAPSLTMIVNWPALLKRPAGER